MRERLDDEPSVLICGETVISKQSRSEEGLQIVYVEFARPQHQVADEHLHVTHGRSFAHRCPATAQGIEPIAADSRTSTPGRAVDILVLVVVVVVVVVAI